jgi:hypothetical protein
VKDEEHERDVEESFHKAVMTEALHLLSPTDPHTYRESQPWPPKNETLQPMQP